MLGAPQELSLEGMFLSSPRKRKSYSPLNNLYLNRSLFCLYSSVMVVGPVTPTISLCLLNTLMKLSSQDGSQ